MTKEKNWKKLALLVIILISFGANRAIAETVDTDDENFDNAIQQFGYLSGNAFQCASSDQSQSIETEALKAFTGIARLFGTDRAFFYAAAYGVGATSKIDKTKCKEYIRQFQEAMNSNSLKKGE